MTNKQNASVKNTKNNTVQYNRKKEQKEKTQEKMDQRGSEGFTGREHLKQGKTKNNT